MARQDYDAHRMQILRQLQDSAFSMWVLGADTIWSYPTVLTLHTVGLAILVGAVVVVDLRVLGVGRAVPPDTIARLYRFVWIGFLINLASGVVLFVVQAADRATQTVFGVKLSLIAIAFVLTLRLQRHLRAGGVLPGRTRTMAAVSLACWVAAIAAGRLMAYL
jgi:hypothetical protein